MELLGIDEQPIEIEEKQLIVMYPTHMISANSVSIHVSLFKCIFCLLVLASCSSDDSRRDSIVKGEYIYRLHYEHLFKPEPPLKKTPEPYPWEERWDGALPKITKEYFRCRGSSLNPMRTITNEKGETQRIHDCGGTDKHSLPLRDGKEFVYPILLELLNTIQSKTAKRVVITCGHRCPDHNTYADPSPASRYSKHMVGAEVSFYVQGLEERPEEIVALILDFYKNKYKGKKEFEFQRYEKGDSDVSTPPWYNKEVFVKLYRKREGRDFDNRHPFPYISIQVRYDMDLNEKVIYTWDKATRNYLRK